MEEKKNKRMYIVAGVLLFLSVLLVILAGILFLGGKGDRTDDNRNAGPFVNKGDETDSTAGDIFNQTVTPDYGTAKSESSISFAGETVRFQVPDGFYSTWTQGTDSYRTETFQTKDYLCVDCSLWSTQTEGDYPSAKAYIDTMLDFARDGAKDGIKTESVKIAGNTCYYIDLHYTYAGTDYQYIYAACDYGRTGIFAVKATALDFGEELSVETVREFFNTED